MGGTNVLKRANLHLKTMNIWDNLKKKTHPKVCKVLYSNCHLTVHEIAEAGGISKRMCQEILIDGHA
jgi:hypothetical protein